MQYPASELAKKPQHKELSLPFAGKSIRQSLHAQAASHASALLAEAALAQNTKAPQDVLELGCGCGVVSIILALAHPAWQITGIDIQGDLVELARQNARDCGCTAQFLEADLRRFTGSYDLILANPPWQKPGSGRLSPYMGVNISRVELLANMQDYLEALKRLLKPEGRAILIYPGWRQKELEKSAANTGLSILALEAYSGKKAYFCATLGRGNTI